MKPSETFGLDGKVAIVTGGTKGLGREIAESLADAGAAVVVTSRTESDTQKVASELSARGPAGAIGVAGDIAEPGVADRLVAAALERFGRLDILVNNAGINVRGAIDQVTPADFDRVIATNLKGPWLLCRAAAKTFKEQRSGRVIQIASTLGIVGMADRSLYCSSKGALAQFTKELAIEWAPANVTVNAICPGPFETEMNASLVADKEKYQRFANFTALGRWGKRGEIGPVAVFLASDAASYITGALLPVDGGWVAW